MSNVPNVRYKTIEQPIFDHIVLNVELIANIILHVNKRSFWRNDYNNTFIAGSYVYKHLLRGESVNDVDVISPDSTRTSKNILATVRSAYHPQIVSERFCYSQTWPDYQKILFKNNPAITVDLIEINQFAKRIDIVGLNFTNCLVLTKDGIRHIFEIPVLMKELHYECDDSIKEREWVIEQIKNKQYCKSNGMRPKDYAYFHDWSVIDFQTCRDHGFND